jgi:hypothetical protein
MKPFSQLFYESQTGQDIWTNHGESMSMVFRNKLIQLYDLLTSPKYNDEYRELEWKSSRRLTWGYNIFNSTLPTKPHFCSKDSYEYIKQGKTTKLVKDHFYGVTESANELRRVFEESGFDIDYMVNEWLPTHYHLFVTWFVTPQEHKKENIDRPTKNKSYTIEEKDNYKHFIGNVSEIVERKTKKELLK